ncbi:Transposase IS4 [Popillia japonica]|uniref:Transposase IS4 n=1 Tax=Popillia japonica TaxID=7064 RepID=A0AAW1N3S4_POPJA
MKLKKRRTGTAMFCYDNELTLLSYKAKPNKIVYLLSSCNEEGTVNTSSGKPNLVEFYNKTKGGIDTLDQMCSVMSCSRKTKRWPMCMFFGILNMAFVNSYVIYVHNMLTAKKKPLSRREFMKQLHADLVTPHMLERLSKKPLS